MSNQLSAMFVDNNNYVGRYMKIIFICWWIIKRETDTSTCLFCIVHCVHKYLCGVHKNHNTITHCGTEKVWKFSESGTVWNVGDPLMNKKKLWIRRLYQNLNLKHKKKRIEKKTWEIIFFRRYGGTNFFKVSFTPSVFIVLLHTSILFHRFFFYFTCDSFLFAF